MKNLSPMTFPPPTERQARIIWLALSGVAIAVLVALVAGLVWGLGQVLNILSPVLWPIAVAGVLAYLLDPLVDLLERRGAKRSRAIIYVFGLALLIQAAVFGSVLPRIIAQTSALVTRVPEYAERLRGRAEYWITHPPELLNRFPWKPGAADPATTNEGTAPPTEGTPSETNLPPDTNAAPQPGSDRQEPSSLRSPTTISPETLKAATEYLAKFLPRAGSWIFGQVGRVASWFGVLAGLALIPVYTFYFLLEKKAISSHWTNYLPVSDSGFKNELVFVLNSINNYLIAFFRGQVLVAICDGVLYGAGFAIIGLPYAALIGFMAVFLTMIPFLGAIVTCVTALVIALVTSGGWTQPLLVLVVFGIVQALEGTVISPKIMGDRVGLHPVTIIIAVMAGTTLLGGILGGILAIPLTAAARVLMFRYVWKRPDQNEGPTPVDPKSVSASP